MYILAFDSCFAAVSVAVAQQGAAAPRLLVETFERRRSGHAERLLPMIEETMRGAGIGFQDLGRLAVTLGPGTFTGVRTGIATARALALASGCPAVGVGTLAATAFLASRELASEAQGRAIAVALDAGAGKVYFQRFDATAAALSAPVLLPPQDCCLLLAGSPAVIVGSGAAAIMNHMAAEAAVETRLADAEPRAAAVALMASDAPLAQPLRPLYLRAPDAKPQASTLPRALS
jgi:tRNA threonylcarbamoyladenosine biosynthesis protein TsaB